MTSRPNNGESRARHTQRVGFAGMEGVPGVEREIEVEIPAGDIAPLDLDTEFRHIGKDADRIDAVAKVTGRARYAYDTNPAGLLHAVMVRSPHASGRVRTVDMAAALAMPGVRAATRLKNDDQRVRFVGDPIAAIAAATLDQARDAARAVVVSFDVDEDFAADLRDADGAPTIDASGEIADPWPESAEVEAALSASAATAQHTWTTEVQTHSSLETHGLVAWFRDDGTLDVFASTQATFGVRQGLASAMDLRPEQVRVHAEFVGGGFGSKFGPDAEGLAAARLSREAKAPVKLMVDRFEEHTVTGNRPSMIAQIRAGVAADGTIKAFDFRSFGGPGFTGRGGGTAYTPSYFGEAATRKSHKDLVTSTDPARSMRAPGWPQGNFAAEGMLDVLAREVGIDPLALRLHNDTDELRRAQWQIAARRFDWESRRNPEPGRTRDGEDPRFLRGAGMASAFWGQMGRPGNEVTCRIHADGTVESRNGAQDIGTGMKTVLAILTAEELGIDPSSVRVTMGDTRDPVGPGSGGSTTTPSLAPTARHAAHLAREELRARVADHLGVGVEDVDYVGSGLFRHGDRQLTFREACRTIGPNPIQATGRRFRNYDGYKNNVCGCQFAEVVVDSATGLVRVTHMLAVQDCGLVLARKLAESQVLGAMIQGIGYALHEQRIMDRRSGRMLNGDMSSYKFPGIADTPSLEAVLMPVQNGKNNVGASGLGEPPAVAAPAAIANAVSNAIGVQVRSLPITPDKVLAALASRSR